AVMTLHQALGAIQLVSEGVEHAPQKQTTTALEDPPPLVYLSDGGHYENLGLLQLLRRRCKLMIVGDVGYDPEGISSCIRFVLDVGRTEGMDFVVPGRAMSASRRITEFSKNAE